LGRPALPQQGAIWLWRYAACTGSLAISVAILAILMKCLFDTGRGCL